MFNLPNAAAWSLGFDFNTTTPLVGWLYQVLRFKPLPCVQKDKDFKISETGVLQAAYCINFGRVYLRRPTGTWHFQETRPDNLESPASSANVHLVSPFTSKHDR
jgi:hypothetical protein